MIPSYAGAAQSKISKVGNNGQTGIIIDDNATTTTTHNNYTVHDASIGLPRHIRSSQHQATFW